MKKTLLATVAAAALALSFGAAQAQMATQTSTNTGTVGTSGQITGPNNNGVGASAAVMSTGATNSASYLSANSATPVTSVPMTSLIAQTSTNTGTINNAGGITSPTNSGVASSSLIGSVGAGNSIGITGLK